MGKKDSGFHLLYISFTFHWVGWQEGEKGTEGSSHQAAERVGAIWGWFQFLHVVAEWPWASPTSAVSARQGSPRTMLGEGGITHRELAELAEYSSTKQRKGRLEKGKKRRRSWITMLSAYSQKANRAKRIGNSYLPGLTSANTFPGWKRFILSEH